MRTDTEIEHSALKTDAQGEPLVHRVDGKRSDSYYLDSTSGTLRGEIEQVFDIYENVYFIVIDNSTNQIGLNGRFGAGRRGEEGKERGLCLGHW